MAVAAAAIALSRRLSTRGRRWCYSRRSCFVLAAFGLVLAIFAGIPALGAGGNAANRAPGSHVTVGKTRVKVGSYLNQGSNGRVYHAEDSKGKPVILKTLHDDASWTDTEIAVTKAAGQYISHDDRNMVQKKVGTHDLGEYLKYKKANPGGWIPNSDDIVKQLEAQQHAVGYIHPDVLDNVRVDATRNSKLV
ncbi:hypothetical protein DFJ73DRAFT_904524 [Zopfochytrium polystomum]|nr:hypothetical protein DFJ73DRAFT_904524 [Zopfochytrium polystomum]